MLFRSYNWSLTAIDCYKRGCICEGCLIQELITSGKCQMKKSVLWLVKKYGMPTEKQERILRINSGLEESKRKRTV